MEPRRKPLGVLNLKERFQTACKRSKIGGFNNGGLVNKDLTDHGPYAKLTKRRFAPSKQRVVLGLDKEVSLLSPTRKKPKKSCFVVHRNELKAYFLLLVDDPMISEFLERDSCAKVSDKYLIAMVFAYFKRAEFTLREYNRLNFFLGLYLANDMEEDEEDSKYEIFPWALGHNWKRRYPSFLKKKDKLWKRIDYRGVVSRACCEEIMAIEADHPVWQRLRSIHHAGAIRSYLKDDDDTYPRGPNSSPRLCPLCDPEPQYDSASPDSTSWYLSSEDDDCLDLCGNLMTSQLMLSDTNNNPACVVVSNSMHLQQHQQPSLYPNQLRNHECPQHHPAYQPIPVFQQMDTDANDKMTIEDVWPTTEE